MLELIDSPTSARGWRAAARSVAQEKYSRESYLRRTAQAYARLGAPAAQGAPDAPSASRREIAPR